MNKDFVIKKLRGEDETTVITARIPNRLVSQLEEIVKNTGQSRTQIIISALEYSLDRLKIEEAE